VAERSESSSDHGRKVTEIDTTVASEARVYDYLLGGVDNFEIDREVAERQGVAAGGIEYARTGVRLNRTYLGQAVRYLAVVLAHAHTLMQSRPEGAAAYLQGDFRDPERILEQAAATLDFSQPIAVMLIALLHFFRDADDPQSIVTKLMAAMPSGSHLAISHMTAELEPERMGALADSPGDQAQYIFVMRTRDEVARFFDGLEMTDRGVSPLADWLTPEQQPEYPASARMHWCGIGRKP